MAHMLVRQSASGLTSVRRAVACGSLVIPPSFAKSMNGVRLRTASSFGSERAMVGTLPLSAPVGNRHVSVSVWGGLTNLLIAVPAHGIISS